MHETIVIKDELVGAKPILFLFLEFISSYKSIGNSSCWVEVEL